MSGYVVSDHKVRNVSALKGSVVFRTTTSILEFRVEISKLKIYLSKSYEIYKLSKRKA